MIEEVRKAIRTINLAIYRGDGFDKVEDILFLLEYLTIWTSELTTRLREQVSPVLDSKKRSD